MRLKSLAIQDLIFHFTFNLTESLESCVSTFQWEVMGQIKDHKNTFSLVIFNISHLFCYNLTSL